VGQDPGLIDLYDARVGGGFAAPVERAECEGEACQSPPPPPDFTIPSSESYRGPGNQPALRSCRAAGKRAARLSRRARRARRAAGRLARAGNRAAARRVGRRARPLAKRAAKASRNAKRCRRANRRAGR